MTGRQGTPKNTHPALGVGPDGVRTDDRMEVKIGPGGRVVIPAASRESARRRPCGWRGALSERQSLSMPAYRTLR